ncbi:hypothetical protein LVJ94_06090 [Pendulispora rubella]|uniref:Uncharacterized protein n=1 Tax=Pendulispora rubella TaxID=2741070 RepID=A0ABZ2L7A2_9BACT
MESASGPPFADIRVHVAIARTLLDEVERQIPPSAQTRIATEQFVEELARLGCRILEAATELARKLDGPSETSQAEGTGGARGA